ncbi:hypothetical protein ACS0TY_029149 [Phlomoides rotata]
MWSQQLAIYNMLSLKNLQRSGKNTPTHLKEVAKMKKINTKQNGFLLLTALLLIIFLSVQAECFSTADSQAAGRCNASRISDCLPDEEEFLMDSESSRRILQAGGQKTINYGKPKVPYCRRDSYGSCIGKDSKNYQKRPCDYKNTCGRRP